MKKFFSFTLFIVLILSSCKHKGDNTQKEVTPPARPEVACKVSILNQVNGSYVKGLKLSIHEAGTNTKVFEEVASFGFVYPKLEQGKSYDIAVQGDETRASSFVKNLKIKSATQDVAVICLTKAQNTRKEAFISLKELKWDDGSDNIDIKDGVTIESPLQGNILATVASSSGAIYNPFSYGFAARLGLGIAPTIVSGHLGKNSVNGNIAEYPKYENDEWTSEVKFVCTGEVWESFIKEEQDLIAVFYDATGNRLEAHNYIIVKPKQDNFTEYQGDEYILEDFHIETKSFASYNQAYSAGPQKGSISSVSKDEAVQYEPDLYFWLKKKGAAPQESVQILGVEVFRREAIDGKEFEKLFNTTYINKSDIRESKSYLGGIVKDFTGTAEVGKEYEYKIKIYLPSGHFIETSVAKCKILPQCKVYLHLPVHNAQLTIPSAYATFDKVLKNFTVKLSEPKLYDAKESSYFTIGLKIRTFNSVEMYKMILRYHFDYMGTGKPEIELATLQNKVLSKATLTELKAKKLFPYYVQPEDLVTFDSSNGTVMLTEELLSSRLINVSDRWDTFKMSEIYYWDVFGSNADILDAVNPRGQQGNVPPSFAKEYKDEKGVISYSRSYGAGLTHATTSENGRFAFTIKGEKDNSSSSSLAKSRENAIAGSYLVKTTSNFDAKELTKLNAMVYGKLDLENGSSWYCIKGNADEDIISKLQKLSGVICVDYEHELKMPTVTKQEGGILKPLNFNDKVFQGSAYSLAITKALEAYDEVGFGENKVLCGIVDSGVAPDHEDLKDAQGKSVIKDYFVQNFVQVGQNLSLQGWRQFGANEEKPDTLGHGSHCVGIMVAVGNNDKGIAGVSWKNTEVVVYRAFGDPISGNNPKIREFAFLDGIRHFAKYVKDLRDAGKLHQACVPLNISVGSGTPSPLSYEVINYALENGVLPVVAMGNDGLTVPSYPTAYSGVLSVGSSNGSDNVSSYSNRGSWISVTAPGESIMSLDSRSNTGYVCYSGTSMAAPFVTGTIAYLASLNPELTPQQMKHIIEKTSDKILGNEHFTLERGYGRINVLKAAKMAKQGNITDVPYSSFALKVKVTPKLREEDGGASFEFEKAGYGSYIPYVFLYDKNEVCIAGGHLIALDPAVQDKSDLNTVSFRGLKPGKYTLKIASYVYTEWPKVYRLIDEKTVDFEGDRDEMVEFEGYSVIVK